MPIAQDLERQALTLQKILEIDLNLRREELKDAILDYEDANPGNNIVGSKCYEFLRHCQNLVWKELARLKTKEPEEYLAWRRGERGYWPLKTNNAAHTNLLKLSERRRMQRLEMAVPGEAGSPDTVREQKMRNRDKTTYNWRRKTTAVWTYQDGRRDTGFPFFMSWTHLDASGNPDPKGRGGFIGYVNLTWIFGPEWVIAENFENADFQAVENEQAEKITAIPHYKNLPSDKSDKKEDKRFAAQTLLNVSAYQPTTSSKPAHPQREHQPGKSQHLEEENFTRGGAAAVSDACGAGDAAGAENPAITRALRLWSILLRLVYEPLFGTGRIRFSQSGAYERTDFKPFMQRKCVELLVENLHAARKDGEINLDEAATRLSAAIEAQAKYLKDNPEAWLLVPDKFLRTGKAHGTLLSAMQHFVKETECPLLPPEPPENEGSRQRRTRLYNLLLSVGGTTPPGVFSRWCVRYRFPHVEACIGHMQLIIKRRRAEGKLPGKEFDNRQGGATAYFASLLSRFDSSAIQKEEQKIAALDAKRRLWKVVEGYHNPNNLSIEQREHRQALIDLHYKLKSDGELLAIVVREAESTFEIRFTDDTFLNRFENLALFQQIIQKQ